MFLDFLESNGVDTSRYQQQLEQDVPRFIRYSFSVMAVRMSHVLLSRVSPRCALDASALVEDPAHIKPTVLPDFYSLKASLKLISMNAYQVNIFCLFYYILIYFYFFLLKSGDIYGIDLSSGLAVHALNLEPNLSVLDLCSAPGA